MKNALLGLVILGSISANAKILTTNCVSARGHKVELVTEITNSVTPPKHQLLTVNDSPVSPLRDVSRKPFYENGKFVLNVQYGRGFYSSASIVVSKCTDELEAAGTATLKEFVGGFAGTKESELNCTCSLK